MSGEGRGKSISQQDSLAEHTMDPVAVALVGQFIVTSNHDLSPEQLILQSWLNGQLITDPTH